MSTGKSQAQAWLQTFPSGVIIVPQIDFMTLFPWPFSPSPLYALYRFTRMSCDWVSCSAFLTLSSGDRCPWVFPEYCLTWPVRLSVFPALIPSIGLFLFMGAVSMSHPGKTAHQECCEVNGKSLRMYVRRLALSMFWNVWRRFSSKISYLPPVGTMSWVRPFDRSSRSHVVVDLTHPNWMQKHWD